MIGLLEISPATTGMLFGGLVGFGVFVLVRMLMRPSSNIRSTLARMDAAKQSSHAQISSASGSGNDNRIQKFQAQAGAWMEAQALTRGLKLDKLRSDLDIMGVPLALKLGEKVLFAIGAFVFGVVMLGVVNVGGIGFPAGLQLLALVIVTALAFFLPDLTIRQEADKRRADFRHVVGSFLDLVAMNLAGGRGLPEALMAASAIGNHWSMIRIRQALAEGRLLGITPWEAMGQLGTNLGVAELRELAASLALAGDEGAKIRTSLLARSATLRRRELAEVEGQAGEKSQSMLVAQLVMVAAFMLFLGFPAAMQLLNAQV